MAGVKAPKERAARRRWPLSEKRRIVELTLRNGASIRAVAREQGVHPTSLCHWKALYRAGKLGAQRPQKVKARTASSATFLPVTIAASDVPPSRTHKAHLQVPGIVEITLPSGTTVRIGAGVLETGVICALIAQLH
jgi:transposase-like protein